MAVFAVILDLGLLQISLLSISKTTVNIYILYLGIGITRSSWWLK